MNRSKLMKRYSRAGVAEDRLSDAEINASHRARQDYLFSDDCYAERCRDNELEMNRLWRGSIKVGLFIGLFFGGLVTSSGQLPLVLFAFAIGFTLALFPAMVSQLFASLFPGWRGMF